MAQHNYRVDLTIRFQMDQQLALALNNVRQLAPTFFWKMIVEELAERGGPDPGDVDVIDEGPVPP
jgi:hypothetical protein